MAEKGETRNPVTHRTPTQMRRMDRGPNSTETAIRRRSNNNKARRLMEQEGKVSKGDGKDVHHVKPQRSGGSNARSNLRVVTTSRNRGWADDKV